MKLKSLILGVALATLTAASANAAVVQFTGDPATNWADGTFSTGLSGHYPDGFSGIVYGPTGAYDNYGQNGESISFTAPVQLNSLTLGKCNVCADTNPTAFTVSLYNAASTLLTSQTIAASSTLSLLTFNTNNVSKATFTFTGGGDLYLDGRTVAWYNVNNVTYGPNSAVPEAATWMMMIAGFGLVGASMRSRRTTAVTA